MCTMKADPKRCLRRYNFQELIALLELWILLRILPTMMLSLLVPVSRDFTCCIGYEALALKLRFSSKLVTWVVPGTGIGIRSHVVTSKVCSTLTVSRPNSNKNGGGLKDTLPSLRFFVTSTTSQTASICVEIFSSTRVCRRRFSAKPAVAG